MKTPTFESTVDILVKAYLNDTLEHANCSACAVGNIIASAMGTSPKKAKDTPNRDLWRFTNGQATEWQNVFCSERPGVQYIQEPEYKGVAKKQIDSTGYTWRELAKIEKAFELKSDRLNMDQQKGAYKDEKMFDGLMNVIDVLAEIHSVDLSVKESAKLLFQKA